MTTQPERAETQTVGKAGPPADDTVEIAEAVRSACIAAAVEAYVDAGMRGLCREGAWEAAIGAIRSIDIAKVVGRSESAGESTH